MNTRLSLILRTFVSILLPVAGSLVPSVGHACSIPVFRYALQFWQPDSFETLAFHRGPLSEDDEKALERLTAAADGIGANVNVQRVDLADESLPEPLLALWKRLENPKLPHLLTLYPESVGPAVTAESIGLAELRLDNWTTSPARKTITERLAAGESAVWVVLEIGDKEKDAAAMKTLEETLEKLEKTLKLPEQVPETDLLFEPDTELKTELRISFSTLAVSRDDDAEKHLVNHLLNSESDLRDFEEPMVFAVFGRGRALPALVGKGINEDVISEVAAFLIGPCSCQVKAENPGFDLLLVADWEMLLQKANAALETSVAAASGTESTEPTPDGHPAAAVSASNVEADATVVESMTPASTVSTAAPPTGATPAADTPKLDGRMVLGLLIVGGLGLAVLIIGTAVILKKNATA